MFSSLPHILCLTYITTADSYFTDSLVNRINAYDYENGQLTKRRLFFDGLASGLAEGTYPDGLCIDSDGYIWSARSVFYACFNT